MLTSQASQIEDGGAVDRSKKQVLLNSFPLLPPGHWQRRQSFGVPVNSKTDFYTNRNGNRLTSRKVYIGPCK